MPPKKRSSGASVGAPGASVPASFSASNKRLESAQKMAAEDLTAIVILDSFSSEMQPATKNRARAVMPVANTPLIDYILESLVVNGVHTIHLATHYAHDSIVNHLHQTTTYTGQSWMSCREAIVQVTKLDANVRNVCGALRNLLDKNKLPDCFFLVPADIILAEMDYRVLWCRHVLRTYASPSIGLSVVFYANAGFVQDVARDEMRKAAARAVREYSSAAGGAPPVSMHHHGLSSQTASQTVPAASPSLTAAAAASMLLPNFASVAPSSTTNTVGGASPLAPTMAKRNAFSNLQPTHPHPQDRTQHAAIIGDDDVDDRSGSTHNHHRLCRSSTLPLRCLAFLPDKGNEISEIEDMSSFARAAEKLTDLSFSENGSQSSTPFSTSTDAKPTPRPENFAAEEATFNVLRVALDRNCAVRSDLFDIDLCIMTSKFVSDVLLPHQAQVGENINDALHYVVENRDLCPYRAAVDVLESTPIQQFTDRNSMSALHHPRGSRQRLQSGPLSGAESTLPPADRLAAYCDDLLQSEMETQRLEAMFFKKPGAAFYAAHQLANDYPGRGLYTPRTARLIPVPIRSIGSYLDANVLVMQRAAFPLTRESNFASLQSDYVISRTDPSVATAGFLGSVTGYNMRGTAVLGQDVVVGAKVDIGGHCVVVRSALGDGVRLHSCTEVHHSVLMKGAEVGSGCRIINSVLGEHCYIGEGIILNNCVIGDFVRVVDPPCRALNAIRLKAASECPAEKSFVQRRGDILRSAGGVASAAEPSATNDGSKFTDGVGKFFRTLLGGGGKPRPSTDATQQNNKSGTPSKPMSPVAVHPAATVPGVTLPPGILRTDRNASVAASVPIGTPPCATAPSAFPSSAADANTEKRAAVTSTPPDRATGAVRFAETCGAHGWGELVSAFEGLDANGTNIAALFHFDDLGGTRNDTAPPPTEIEELESFYEGVLRSVEDLAKRHSQPTQIADHVRSINLMRSQMNQSHGNLVACVIRAMMHLVRRHVLGSSSPDGGGGGGGTEMSPPCTGSASNTPMFRAASTLSFGGGGADTASDVSTTMSPTEKALVQFGNLLTKWSQLVLLPYIYGPPRAGAEPYEDDDVAEHMKSVLRGVALGLFDECRLPESGGVSDSSNSTWPFLDTSMTGGGELHKTPSSVSDLLTDDDQGGVDGRRAPSRNALFTLVAGGLLQLLLHPPWSSSSLDPTAAAAKNTTTTPPPVAPRPIVTTKVIITFQEELRALQNDVSNEDDEEERKAFATSVDSVVILGWCKQEGVVRFVRQLRGDEQTSAMGERCDSDAEARWGGGDRHPLGHLAAQVTRIVLEFTPKIFAGPPISSRVAASSSAEGADGTAIAASESIPVVAASPDNAGVGDVARLSGDLLDLLSTSADATTPALLAAFMVSAVTYAATSASRENSRIARANFTRFLQLMYVPFCKPLVADDGGETARSREEMRALLLGLAFAFSREDIADKLSERASAMISVLFATVDEDEYNDRAYCLVTDDSILAFDDEVVEFGECLFSGATPAAGQGEMPIDADIARGWGHFRSYVNELRR